MARGCPLPCPLRGTFHVKPRGLPSERALSYVLRLARVTSRLDSQTLVATPHFDRRLRELRLHNNQLSRLPDCVPEMRGLELLDLRGNTIEALPPELKYLRALLDLDLDGNPIGPEVRCSAVQ